MFCITATTLEGIDTTAKRHVSIDLLQLNEGSRPLFVELFFGWSLIENMHCQLSDVTLSIGLDSTVDKTQWFVVYHQDCRSKQFNFCPTSWSRCQITMTTTYKIRAIM